MVANAPEYPLNVFGLAQFHGITGAAHYDALTRPLSHQESSFFMASRCTATVACCWPKPKGRRAGHENQDE
jgi:hypothetical protein